MSLLSSTSAIVFWTQPPFSFTPDNYTVTLLRVIGTGDDEVEVTDRRPTTTTDASMEFTALQTSSVYIVTVAASFSAFGTSTVVPASTRFITLSSGTVNSYAYFVVKVDMVGIQIFCP